MRCTFLELLGSGTGLSPMLSAALSLVVLLNEYVVNG